MDALVLRVAGVDVHKDSVVACVLCGPPEGAVEKQLRTFGTTTQELLTLRDWLEALAIETIVLEATGIYWRPIFNVLQAEPRDAAARPRARLILANPHRIKNVPGRKTDVLDAEWIAQLARHGLVAASFVPPINQP